FLAGQLTLGLAQRADFRNGVDAGRHIIDKPPTVILDDVTRRRTPLVERRTGQARPADHIPGRVDIRHLGTVVFVDQNLAAAVGLQADILQPQAVSITGATVTPQQRVTLDLLA